MKTTIQVKIKTKDGKNIVLDNDEAKELYDELSKIYKHDVEFIPYGPYRYFTYSRYPEVTWTSTNKNLEIMCNAIT